MNHTTTRTKYDVPTRAQIECIVDHGFLVDFEVLEAGGLPTIYCPVTHERYQPEAGGWRYVCQIVTRYRLCTSPKCEPDFHDPELID